MGANLAQVTMCTKSPACSLFLKTTRHARKPASCSLKRHLMLEAATEGARRAPEKGSSLLETSGVRLGSFHDLVERWSRGEHQIFDL